MMMMMMMMMTTVMMMMMTTKIMMMTQVIFLPAHPASFTHILSLGCKVFISVSTRMQWYCRLVMKNSVLYS